ncbi:SDR family oxidoreductase [Gemmobacter lanyuensis]
MKAKIAAGERNPEAILETTALKKFVQPEDIAEAVMFLCSDRAASITGVTLPVDAGWLVQAPYAHYQRGNPIRS